MGRHTGVAAFGVLPGLFSNLFLQDAMCMSEPLCAGGMPLKEEKKKPFSLVG